MFFERPFIIVGFSSMHRLQFRFPFLPACICLTMGHLIENCLFSLSRFQTCLDNFVSCLYFSLRRDSNDFCILSYVCLSHGWCTFGFINYALCQAFTVSGAVLALSAVAELFVVSINVFRSLACWSVFLEWFYCPCLKKDFKLLVQL